VNWRNLIELIIAVTLSAIILSYPDFSTDNIVIFGLIPSICIVFHEIAHEITAHKYGKVDVRIRAYFPGLILGLITALRSNGAFILMLPAYTCWEEPVSPIDVLFDESPDEVKEMRYRRMLKVDAEIAIVGPAVNGLISLVSLLILIVIKSLYSDFYSFLLNAVESNSYFHFLLPLTLLNLAWFNGLLSIMNLIPLPIPILSPVPPFFIHTDGLIFVSSLIELVRRGEGKSIPWKMFFLSLLGASIYIALVFLGLISGEVCNAYENFRF